MGSSETAGQANDGIKAEIIKAVEDIIREYTYKLHSVQNEVDNLKKVIGQQRQIINECISRMDSFQNHHEEIIREFKLPYGPIFTKLS